MQAWARSVNGDLNSQIETGTAGGDDAIGQGTAGCDIAQEKISVLIVDVSVAAIDDDVRRRTAYGGNRTTGKTSVHIDRAYADGAAALVRNIGVAAGDGYAVQSRKCAAGASAAGQATCDADRAHINRVGGGADVGVARACRDTRSSGSRTLGAAGQGAVGAVFVKGCGAH